MHTVDAEIFAVGVWNRMKFTLQDLKDIAANFEALAENHKVPLKFGHNEEQPMTDGYPALGWVSKVWVEGQKLKARFEDVPGIVFKAFDQKLYRHVSVELDVDVEHRGKKYKYVLSAVALLGADIPAVNTLADLKHYIDGGERLAASRREAFSAVEGNLNSTSSKEETMDKKEMEDAIAAAVTKAVAEQTAKFTAELSPLKAENETLKAEAKKREEADAGTKVKMARDKLTAKLEAAVKDKVLTPAQREGAIRFMRLSDDKAVLDVTEDQVDEYIKINGNAKKVNMSDQGKGNGAVGGAGDGKTYDDPGVEITARAKKLQAEDGKLSFAAARDRVMEGDPELAKAWLGGEDDAA